MPKPNHAMGRPPKNRQKISVMIDRRLMERIDALQKTEGITRSEAVNRMLWLGLTARPNLVEKAEIFHKIDIMADYCKALHENGL